MQAHAADAGVFIRSMATRGHLGGLARATGDAALVLDAAGKDVVIIETVGVGQDEVDIVRTADVSIVVLVPGTGDDVQALKAGIMEIADIFVVNKADREGADRLVSAIEANLALQTFAAGRVAAADSEDRGDDRRRRSGAVERDRAVSRAVRRRSAAGAARGTSTACASCWADSSFTTSSGRAAAWRVRPHSSDGSRPATIDPYAAAAELMTPMLCTSSDCPRSPIADSSMKASLDHIGIAVRNVDAALAFYRDALGLAVDPPGGGGVAARARALRPGSASRRSNCSRPPDPTRRSRSTSEARPRAASHHAARRRHRRRAGAAARRAASG